MEPAVKEEFREIRSLFGDIGKQSEEARRQFAELRQQFRETDERIEKSSEETRRQFQETRKQFSDLRQQFQETDARLDKKFQETDARLDKKFQETDARLDKKFRETDARLDKRVRETEKQIGALGNRWGCFVENIIVPGIKNLFLTRDLKIRHLQERVRASRDGRDMEIDILAVDGDFVILIEVKSSLAVGDVKHTIEVVKNFRFFFPEYQERKILGAVAGIAFEENSDRFAYRHGLFVIGQKGDNVIFLNDDTFQPKAY